MSARRRGRPTHQVLTRERILDTTLAVLEREGLAAVTLRGVARRLRVDPMALYYYFRDKHALLRAAAAHAYAQLDPAAGTTGTWRQRLESLGLAYVEQLARGGELMRYLAAHEDAAQQPTLQFAARFRSATSGLALREADRRAAHDVFVDFLHGFSLGVGRTLTPAMRRRLRDELALVCDGIASRARGTKPRSAGV